jgi:hypothetical protein
MIGNDRGGRSADPTDPALYDLTFDLDEELGDDEVIRQVVAEVEMFQSESLDNGYSEIADLPSRP